MTSIFDNIIVGMDWANPETAVLATKHLDGTIEVVEIIDKSKMKKKPFLFR